MADAQRTLSQPAHALSHPMASPGYGKRYAPDQRPRTATDFARLAPLVTDWYARGATDADVTRALTNGLPTPVHHPADLIHNRLTTKLPPERPTPRPLRVLECAKCGVPGRPEALPGGICGACRGERAPAQPSTPLPAPAIHARAAEIRTAMSQRRREKAPT
ncbi:MULTISPECIES: hypothetical protein [unclassified Streptomyces]|uniref:hypothetical protein n=1 Tax=unclassified Streptomyces TaxID=2593676 RepID=UPI002B1D8E87|nr:MULTISPECIES: hypothetical protein [unclassified Streptomyces]